MKKITALSILLFFIQWSYAQKGADKAINGIEKQQAEYADIAMKIWNLAEVGYQEVESSKLLKENLKAEGFTIEENVAGIPTAFIASYGTGKPVIGILGEFDALPGISQKAVPHKDPLVEGGAGHACGHHLFGTASV
ncbi:MAG: amidohydrolase, partial [Cyclobacteriaceae bacterium]|nr:amidohydrolase [Cyclobacteriaceae bacterium]